MRAASFFVATLILLAAPTSTQANTGTWIRHKGKASLSKLFRAELLVATRKGKHTVVMFTADWCTPCKALKTLLDESKYVQRQVRKGHILYIDVDAWRGPAHRLIPGSNPKSLPLLVRVDRRGRRVIQTHGSALGLLSEKAVGDNLARLIDGKKPLRPAYLDNPAKRRALIRKEAERATKRKSREPTVSVRVLARWPGGPKTWRWALKITLRNKDGQRRYVAMAMNPGVDLRARSTVGSYERIRFKEHVRANYFRFYGSPALAVFPLAGHSLLSLNAWTTTSPRTAAATLVVWELDALIINGLKVPFEKKIAYALKIGSAGEVKVVRTFTGPLKLELKAARRHTVPLKR